MSQLFQKITKKNIEQMIDLYNKGVDNSYVVLNQFDTKENRNVSVIAQRYQDSIYLKTVYTNNLNVVQEIK